MTANLKSHLDSLGHSKFITTVESMLLSLDGHPLLVDPIPEPFPTVERVTGSFGLYRNLYHGAINGDRVQGAQRNMQRVKVTDEIVHLGTFLRTKAGTRIEMLLGTGFEVKPLTKSAIVAYYLNAPANFRVTHSTVSKELIVAATREKFAGSYYLEMCEGDVTEEGWKPAGTHIHCSKIVVSGLEPGKRYTFRIRAIGAKGDGPWATSNTIMCL